MTSTPNRPDLSAAIVATPVRDVYARDVPAGLTLGRCHRCDRAVAWKGRDGARIADVACPWCRVRVLRQTSRRLKARVAILDDEQILELARHNRDTRQADEQAKIDAGDAVRVRDLRPGQLVTGSLLGGRILRVLLVTPPHTGTVHTIVGDHHDGSTRTVHVAGHRLARLHEPDRVVAGTPEVDMTTGDGRIVVDRWVDPTAVARTRILLPMLEQLRDRRDRMRRGSADVWGWSRERLEHRIGDLLDELADATAQPPADRATVATPAGPETEESTRGI